MKTLREIQDEVAKDYGFHDMEELLNYKDNSFTKAFIYDCLRKVQVYQQLKIEKRVTEDCSNWNFDSQSIINDNNLIK